MNDIGFAYSSISLQGINFRADPICWGRAFAVRLASYPPSTLLFAQMLRHPLDGFALLAIPSPRKRSRSAARQHFPQKRDRHWRDICFRIRRAFRRRRKFLGTWDSQFAGSFI